MKDSPKDEYINYRISKAKETLEVVELLVENEKWNAAINRLYYAAFYAVSRLLAKLEINTKTHNGVKTKFFLEFIKTGKIDKKYGWIYSDLSDWRQKGDYGDFFDFTKADVHSILEPTKELIAIVIKQIHEK